MVYASSRNFVPLSRSKGVPALICYLGALNSYAVGVHPVRFPHVKRR
jgi:hypothetical protein